MTTPISRLVSTARTTSALSCSGDGTDSPRRFRRFGVILRTRRERTRSAHGDRLDRLVFLVGWHVGVRGALIVGRLCLDPKLIVDRWRTYPTMRPRHTVSPNMRALSTDTQTIPSHSYRRSACAPIRTAGLK